MQAVIAPAVIGSDSTGSSSTSDPTSDPTSDSTSDPSMIRLAVIRPAVN